MECPHEQGAKGLVRMIEFNLDKWLKLDDWRRELASTSSKAIELKVIVVILVDNLLVMFVQSDVKIWSLLDDLGEHGER